MKISDWKIKVQGLFRPARHDHALVANGPRTLAAKTDRKPVEISIISAAVRFVHAPSLEDAVVDPRDMSLDPYHDDLERAAAEGPKRWDGKSVRDIDTERFYDHPHLETHTALQARVPLQARPEFWNPAPHDWLMLNGGAIGIGLPMATGAAVDRPRKKLRAPSNVRQAGR